MKRLLLFVLVCAIGAVGARAQINVSGNLQTLGVQNASGANTYARFILQNYAGALPIVTSTGAMVSDFQDFHTNGSGAISGQIWGNDAISPVGTTYRVCIFYNGIQFRCANYSITAALFPSGFNLNTATPIITTPATPTQATGARSFVFTQSTPLTTWVINHNFNDSHPVVACYSLIGTQLTPSSVTITDPNDVTVTFGSPQTGSCTVISAGYLNLSTNVPNAVVTNPAGTQTVQGPSPLNLQGPVTTRYLNNIRKADGFSGADASIKMNACIADAIAAGGGTCDATGLTGAQTISQEVDIGNHAQVPVLLMLPQQFTWTVTISNGTSSAFMVFSGSTMFGPAQQPVGVNTATIQTTPTTNVVALVTTEPSPAGAGQYVRVEGFTLYNPGGGSTITDAALVARNLYDNSAFRNITVASYNGTNLHVSGACCQAVFDRITLNGGSLAGAIPLKIDLAYGTNAGISFTNMSIDHPGDTLNNIVITGGTTPLTASQINFSGLYMEGTTNTSHLATPLVSINGGGRYLFSGVTVSRLASNSTAYVFDLTNGTFPTEFKVDSFGFYSDLGANTYTTGGEVVNDHIKGLTVKADPNGLLPMYGSGGVVLTTSGNLGIGVANPGVSLDTAGSVRVTNQLISTQATGAAPLSVSSTTPVPNLTVQNCSTCALTTPTIGGGSTLNHANYFSTASITPTAVTAATCSDQTFTVAGVATGDKLGSVIPPGALGNVSVNADVSAANTVRLHFCNPSAINVTPPAGVYSFLDFN